TEQRAGLFVFNSAILCADGGSGLCSESCKDSVAPWGAGNLADPAPRRGPTPDQDLDSAGCAALVSLPLRRGLTLCHRAEIILDPRRALAADTRSASKRRGETRRARSPRR